MTSGGDWVEQARRLMESLRAAVPPPGEPTAAAPGAGLSGDCRWCPLCQAAAMVRGERPELSAALADILTATAEVLRQVAGETPAAAPDDAVAEEPDDSPPPPVQRIELS